MQNGRTKFDPGTMKGTPVKEKAIYIGLGVVLGIVFSSQISRLPLVNKIPQV